MKYRPGMNRTQDAFALTVTIERTITARPGMMLVGRPEVDLMRVSTALCR